MIMGAAGGKAAEAAVVKVSAVVALAISAKIAPPATIPPMEVAPVTPQRAIPL